MRKSKVFLIVGCVMVLAAIIFIIFAMNHPEMIFIGGNTVAYPIYIVYVIITVIMFIMASI